MVELVIPKVTERNKKEKKRMKEQKNEWIEKRKALRKKGGIVEDLK